jgi:hypothetical protein
VLIFALLPSDGDGDAETGNRPTLSAGGAQIKVSGARVKASGTPAHRAALTSGNRRLGRSPTLP